jgi:hypothetical protein
MIRKVGSGFCSEFVRKRSLKGCQKIFLFWEFLATYQPHKATWRSGYATVCKTTYFPSNFNAYSEKKASNKARKINNLDSVSE